MVREESVNQSLQTLTSLNNNNNNLTLLQTVSSWEVEVEGEEETYNGWEIKQEVNRIEINLLRTVSMEDNRNQPQQYHHEEEEDRDLRDQEEEVQEAERVESQGLVNQWEWEE